MPEPQTPANAPELRSAFIAHLDNIEVREAQSPGDEFTLTGHAAVFNKWSEDLFTFAGTFRERLAPGAFTDVLKQEPDVRLLYNHDGLTLARTKAGTLELSEDEEGLRVWAKLAPTSIATDLRMAMQRGDVDQMSFAFSIAEDEWHEDHDTEEVERTILRVDQLFDVSVVSFPAYPDTDAAIRELRSAAEAGKIHPPVAQPETDAAGEEADPISAEAETDPPVDEGRDVSAEAETDPPVDGRDSVAALQAHTSERAQRERESYLRIIKELAR